jgi:hypothetical protein
MVLQLFYSVYHAMEDFSTTQKLILVSSNAEMATTKTLQKIYANLAVHVQPVEQDLKIVLAVKILFS